MGGVWPNQRGYLNKPYSSFTNITDIGARKYDPVTGRFTSVDPQLDPAMSSTHNGYAYTAADPINQVDPTGLEPVSPIDILSNGIITPKNAGSVQGGYRAPSTSRVLPWQTCVTGGAPVAAAPAISPGPAAMAAVTVGGLAGAGAAALALPIVGPVGAAAVSGAVSGAVTYVMNQMITGQDVNIEDLLLTTVFGALLGAGLGKVANAPVVRQFIKEKAGQIASIFGKRSHPDVPAAAPKPPKTTTPTPTTPAKDGATTATNTAVGMEHRGRYQMRRGGQNCFMDRFGNEWIVGPSRTPGEPSSATCSYLTEDGR